MSFHHHRAALAEGRRRVPQHLLLLLERKEIEDVDDRDHVALGGRVGHDVAHLEPEPLGVADGAARDLDLPRIEIDPKHTAIVRRLAEEAREEAVAAAEVDDEAVARDEAFDERQVREERPSVDEEPRSEWRGAVTVDGAVQGAAGGRLRNALR